MRSERGWPGPSIAAWGLLAAVLVTAGCGSSGWPPAPSPSGSSRLPAACVAPEAGQACISQIAAQVQHRATVLADGATVTHDHVLAAVGPIAEAVREIPTGAGYELRTNLRDADAEAKATTPLLMSWQVGTATQDLWACFHEGGVTVSASPCER